MSLHEINTSKQLLRLFLSQENAQNKHPKGPKGLVKVPRGPKTPKNEMSAELQQIRNEYEVLKRKNQEEIEIIRKIDTCTYPSPRPPDLGHFLGRGGCSRETIKNFQILINNEFTGSIEAKREILEAKNNEEMSFMKEFLSITEMYKSETEKLSEQSRRLKMERDDLKRKLEEIMKKFEAQNLFLQDLEANNESLQLKLGQTNKEVEKEIRHFIVEAETEKKRYLGSLKKLIEIFQIEKLRIEETFSNLNSDVLNEKSRHFQDVERLNEIIEQLREENEKNKIYFYSGGTNYNLQQKRSFQVFQEIEEYRKYAHELEMIIRNLGSDIQTLEDENVDLKKRHEGDIQELKTVNDNAKLKLYEEIEMFKQKYHSLQDVKSENQYILEENEALKINLKSCEDKFKWRIQQITNEFKEKQELLSNQIEDQTQTIEKLKTEQTNLEATITNLLEELKQKNAEIEKLEAANHDLNIQNKILKSEIEKGQQIHEQKIKEHKEQTSKLINYHETETKNLKSEMLRLEKERRDFQTGMIEQETLYKILKVDFDEFIFERNGLEERFNQEKEIMNEDFQKRIEELHLQIEELKALNLNYEGIERELHREIQGLVHNINELNTENKKEVAGVRTDVIKQVGQELEGLKLGKEQLEDQMLQLEKENATLKTDLQYKEQKCSNLEDELKSLKNSYKDVNLLLEDSKEHYENEVLQMKLTNERNMKRSKDEIERLCKEFEQQSLFCDHLDKRKKELERLNTKFSDNLEQVTKVYDREVKDLKLDLQNTKTFYENKMSYAKNEALFEAKKYENRINELEQELKMNKYEVQWLRESQKE